MREKTVDGTRFILFEPKPRWVPTITVGDDDIVKWNSAMKSYMAYGQVCIGLSERGDALHLEESASSDKMKRDFTKMRGIAEYLRHLGQEPPCVYEMKKAEDGSWCGKLIEPVPKSPKPESAAEKPRRRGMNAMMPSDT